jgi:hypothetical protein
MFGPLGVLAYLPSITKDGESDIIHKPGVLVPVMDILYIFHILLIPSFLHKTFAIESPSLYLFHILLYHASLLNSKTPFYLLAFFRVKDQHPQSYLNHGELSAQTFTQSFS